MLFKRDFGNQQFVELNQLYEKAKICLGNLRKQYPEYNAIWDDVEVKMKVIKTTIDKDEVPNDEQKRSADISTMLTYKLRDFPDDNAILPLFNLDRAYTLLGMKDINFETNRSLK